MLAMTLGKNAKAYVAGTQEPRSREVVWVGGPEKNSNLFIEMLRKLYGHCAKAAIIHVALDNYGIRKSNDTRAVPCKLSRIRLHLLPPYCPGHNLIVIKHRDPQKSELAECCALSACPIFFVLDSRDPL